MSDSPHILRAGDALAAQATFSHPWNPNSEITGTHLSRTLGLSRSGVGLARIAPGKESFTYHSHTYEEEWLYILSGRAIAEIDGNDYQVGAGDFLAFPTPSVAHHLRNPFDEEVVYLMGGEHREFEIADFPKLGKRMIRQGKHVEICNLSDLKPFGPLTE